MNFIERIEEGLGESVKNDEKGDELNSLEEEEQKMQVKMMNMSVDRKSSLKIDLNILSDDVTAKRLS
jgi:hypothetical protein